MGFTKPEAGVIATSPATAPEIAPRTLGLPAIIHSTVIQLNTAAAVAKCVATNALDAKRSRRHRAARVESEPAYPQQAGADRHSAPRCAAASIRPDSRAACPGTSAHTSAETPEVMCTTVPPAKSKAGNLPPSVAVQQAALAPHHVRHRKVHHAVDHSVMNSSMAENFIRSANAPEISAGVMMANINW